MIKWLNIAKIGAGGKQGPVSLDLPLKHVIKRGDQVDINILDAAIESLKLSTTKKTSWGAFG